MSEDSTYSMILKLSTDFQLRGFAPPLSIEVDKDFAQRLCSEIRPMLQYSDHQRFPHNCALVNGILIIAPKNFMFTA